MSKLNEYQQEIKNDDDLNRWKSTWDGVSDIPSNVVKYMNEVVLPQLLSRSRNDLNVLMSDLSNENK
jgi:hypothetical protein